MPISVKCPECEAPYKVPDEAAGKAIKCKKCGAKISIPAPAAPPAEAGDDGGNDFAGMGPGDDSVGEPKEKKKAGSKKMLLIIGGVVLLFGCCCVVPSGTGGLGWYLGWFGGKEGKAVAGKDGGIKIQPDAGKDNKKITKDNYNKIRDGMPIAEVKDILGPPTTEAKVEVAGLTMMTWQGGTLAQPTIISITAEKGQVKTKSILGP